MRNVRSFDMVLKHRTPRAPATLVARSNFAKRGFSAAFERELRSLWFGHDADVSVSFDVGGLNVFGMIQLSVEAQVFQEIVFAQVIAAKIH